MWQTHRNCQRYKTSNRELGEFPGLWQHPVRQRFNDNPTRILLMKWLACSEVLISCLQSHHPNRINEANIRAHFQLFPAQEGVSWVDEMKPTCIVKDFQCTGNLIWEGHVTFTYTKTLRDYYTWK
jgi:hypothetical protein